MPSLRLLRISCADHPDPARLIADRAPDVAVVHDAPSRLRWRSKGAALARRAGLVVVGGGRTGGGTLLLSTLGVDVLAVRDVAFGRGPQPDGAALAALRRRDGSFALAGARFGAQDRPGQVEPLRRELDRLVPERLPAVVVADVPESAWPESEALRPAADGVLVDASIAVTDVQASDGVVVVELELPS